MSERGSRWAVAAPPIVFESEDLVDSFSEFILNAHEEIQAKSGCFQRVVSRECSEAELAEKLRSWACADGPSPR